MIYKNCAIMFSNIFHGGFTVNEKVYKTMGSTGAGSIAIGIVVLVGGLVSGILMIINGARLLKKREHLMF